VKVAVLVAGHLANEFGAVRTEPSKGVLDVVDGEHDAVKAQRLRRAISGLALIAFVVWYVDSSSRPGASAIRIIAISLRMSSSPTTLPAQLPSIGILPSSSMPSSVNRRVDVDDLRYLTDRALAAAWIPSFAGGPASHTVG
jgi:hypothetical protein